MTPDDIKKAREIIEAATPALDADGNEYYLGGIPFTDTSSGKVVHQIVKYTAERFAERAREGWAAALDEIDRLNAIIASPLLVTGEKIEELCAENRKLRAENDRLQREVGCLKTVKECLSIDEYKNDLFVENERYYLTGEHIRKIGEYVDKLRTENELLRAVAEAVIPAMEVIDRAFADYGWVLNLRRALKSWREHVEKK